MTAMLYGQVAVNALMLGATYALVAVGLSLVFSIMRVIQFAHGHLYMLGAFCVFYLATEFGVNYFAALLIAAIAVGLLGMVLDRVFLRPLRGQDLPSMIVTLGLLLLIEGSALGMFIGSALAAAAAGLLLPIQVLTPAVGGPVVIKTFMVVILGGLGSIPGAVLGSLAFGALESFGTTFFGGYSSLAAFSAVMLILIFRPRGLLGRA